MKFINNVLEEEKDYKRLKSVLSSGELPAAVSGLVGIHRAVIASALNESTAKRFLMITDTESAAASLKDDLLALGIKAGQMPVRDYNLTQITGYSKEYEIMRIDTLSRILDGGFGVVCASIESATQYTVSPEVLRSGTFMLAEADTVNIDEIISKLVNIGYNRADICEGAGQFSVRGGIIDIFSAGLDAPVRIELFRR